MKFVIGFNIMLDFLAFGYYGSVLGTNGFFSTFGISALLLERSRLNLAV